MVIKLDVSKSQRLARSLSRQNHRILIRSLCVSGKLPTYPSLKPTFCPKWEVSVNVGLGEGWKGGKFPRNVWWWKLGHTNCFAEAEGSLTSGHYVACVASVSVRLRSTERGTRVKGRAKNGVSERAGRGWGRKEGNACRQTPGFWKPPTWPVMLIPSFPSPSPHFHFLALV